MKITSLKPFVISPGEDRPNWVLVKVYTDEGVSGVGEAFMTGKDQSQVAALHEFEDWLIGKDPTRIIHNWLALYHGARYPLGTATLSALSAVEQALWDIAGKSCGLPVYKMLGGACRDRIRVYAGVFHLSGPSIAEDAKRAAEAGFTAIKPNAHPVRYWELTPEQLHRQTVERVRTIREAIGDDVDLCLEYHGISFNPAVGVRLAQAVEPYHPFFLEEPTLQDNLDSLAEVKAKSRIPIAAGERCVTRQSMRELIEKRAAHIIQPEPMANGGLLQTVKLAALAELHHIQVAPHQTGSPVSMSVCRHIDACPPNFLIQEFNLVDSPCARDLFGPIPQVVDGYLSLPDGPGLGVELNEEAAAAYAGEPWVRRVIIQMDGSIGH